MGSILAGLFGGWLWFAYAKLGLPNAGKSVADQLFTTPGNGGLSLIACCLIAGAVIYYVGERRAQVAGHRPLAQLPRDPARVGVVFRRRKAEGGGGGAPLRLYYASDIHGTEVLWLKFLNAPKHYKAQVLVMGGDVTGKMVIPLVEDPPGVFSGQLFGRRERAESETELATLERRIRGNGMYPYRTTAAEVARIADLPEEERERWFEGVMLQHVLALARCRRRAARRHRRAAAS